MILIEINTNKCRIVGDRKVVDKVKKFFKVRHPGAFHIRKSGRGSPNWDGQIHYITEAGYFKTGLLKQVYDHLVSEYNVTPEFDDQRSELPVKPKLPKTIGEHDPRKYQGSGILNVIENKVGDVIFPYCVIDAATNAGKSTLMAGIYLAYKRKIPTLVLLNDADLFEQFKKEMPKLVGDDYGYVRGKEQKWGNFTVAMVPTLARDVRKYVRQLEKVGILLVDEADLSDNKSYKTVIESCPNTVVRVGLSGSIFLSKLKKDKVKTQNLHGLFGETVFKITKQEMVDLGFSTEVITKMYEGSDKPAGLNYKQEYDEHITYNDERALKCVERVKFNIKLGRLPALVVCQFHDHIDLMYKVFQNQLGKKYTIRYVHGDVNGKIRKKIFEDFATGKIDILISSYIVKRGKNMPLTKYLLNAAGGKSQETVWQIRGRLERKDDSKKRAYMEDLWDSGKYLSRHSRRRFIYYKQAGAKVYNKSGRK
jgi:superfamily II DNA or RNA helicase